MINTENKITTIKMNKLFYPENKIRKAINDFSNMAKIDLNEDKNYYEIKISRCYDKTTDTKKVGLEFCNYTIALMKQ